jgi:hypothetical protein
MNMACSMHNGEVPNRQSNPEKSGLFEELGIGEK